MCGFIAQLVEHRTGIAEVTGSNPVEALIFFRLLLSNCLNWKIYCDDHSSLEVACPNLSMKSTFAPAKNRKDRTSTADCGVPAAFGAATLSGSGDMPSVENTFPKNFTARRLSQLFFRLSVSQCSRRSFNICLRALSCSSDVAPKTSMPSQMLIAFGCCAKTLQTSSLKISAALLTPKCSLLKSSMRVKCGKLPAFLGEFQLHVSIVHVYVREILGPIKSCLQPS